MRSVFVIFKEADRKTVEEFLNATFAKNGCEWIDGGSLYIRFYEDAELEFSSDLLRDIRTNSEKDAIVSVVADISGRIDGTLEAFAFCTRLLCRYRGWAMDDYSDHLWTLEELDSKEEFNGHAFFDHASWYNERGPIGTHEGQGKGLP